MSDFPPTGQPDKLESSNLHINLDMVGCRLNQSEIEQYGRQFRAAGHTLVGEAADADLVVINTCAVTSAASADSRLKARQAHRAGASRIVLTGCWSTLEPVSASAIPGVMEVVPNEAKEGLVSGILGVQPDTFDIEPTAREPLPGARLRTRAFIKVQDGCDNRCTFCVTTIARGAGRSRRIPEVIADIRAAILGGTQEAVLTGVHLGSWGQDFQDSLHLENLVTAVLEQTEIPRLRLSSLEPWDLDDDFFKVWENPRLCRHLHLPLQSGSEPTLRRMARKTTPGSFSALLDAARSVVPDMAVTTDVIVGFPGETENEFQESLDFVRHQAFAGGHVFTYSSREGTAAAEMPDQVHNARRKARNQQMREVLTEAALVYQNRFLGRELQALWETTTEMGPKSWRLHGLTDNQLRISAEAPRDQWNQLSSVKVIGIGRDGMQGVLI